MGRPWQRKTGQKQTGKRIRKEWGKRTSNINVDVSLDELDDEIDKFHKGSDKIPLDVNDSDLSEDQMEDPIFNLKEESSEEEDASEDEDEDLDEEKLSGLAAKMAKQAKILKQKTRLAEDEEEEEEGEKEKDGGKGKQALWGKRKRTYYNADNVDFELQSSDEEGLAEEETEALQMQRLQAELLQPEDFELDDDMDAVPSPQTHGNAIQDLQEGKNDSEKGHDASRRRHLDGLAKDAKVSVEEVKKDLNALSKEEQMEVVMSDAPELVGLLADLKEALYELQNKVEPLLEKVKGGHVANNNGLSFLETKHMLLLCYCQSIVFYLLMKAEGRSVRDHPVIARLVEMRTFLDKFQSLDKRLKGEIDKLPGLLKESFLADGMKVHLSETDDQNQKPHAELGFKMDQVDFGNKTLLALPTTKSSAVLKEDAKSKNPKYYTEESKGLEPENVLGSTHRKAFADKLEKVIAPESKEMLEERSRLKSHSQDNLKGLGKSLLLNSGQQKLNQVSNIENRLMSGLDDFDDEIAELEDVKHDEVGGKPKQGKSSRKLSQIIAEAGNPSKKTKIASGDADVPLKEDLGERRAKYEQWKASKVEYGEDEMEELDEIPLVEDEFYQMAKQKKAAKQAAKELMYSRIPTAAQAVEEETGKRHISYQMEKNKGLTPHRKRLTKNPRKRYKVKHQKALIRRKGQIREVKPPTGPYGGENTGIRSNISRSVRFQT